MTRNEGTVDRWLRVIVAALGWWLAAALGYGSVGGVIVLIVAAILVVTGVSGYCPAYTLLGVSTRDGRFRTAPASGAPHARKGHPAR